MINLKKKRVIVLIAAIIVAIVIALYFRAVPKLISLEKHRPQIEQAIKDKIAFPVNIGRLDTSMTWNLGVKIHIGQASINHNNGKKFIETGPVSVELALLPFLRNQVVIREIYINSLVAHTIRLKDGTFDIEELFPKKLEEPTKYKVLFRKSRIIIDNYQIFFQDKYINPEKFYTLVGNKLRISDFNPRKFIRVDAAGQIVSVKKPNTYFDITYSSRLPFNKKSILNNDITVQGKILHLYPGMFLAYLSKYTSYKYTALAGSADLDINSHLTESKVSPQGFFVNARLNNVYAKKPGKGLVVNLPGISNIVLQGRFNSDLILDEASFTSNKAKLSLKGAIHNYRSKYRTLNLRLFIDSSRIKPLIEAFPKQIRVPLNAVVKVKKHGIDGNIWTDLLIQGTPRFPELNGKIKFNNVSTNIDTPGVKGAYGQINFKGKPLILDVYAFTRNNGKIHVYGTVIPVKVKKLNLNVRSNTIDLARAEKLLLVIRDIFNFKLGPVKDINIMSGSGKVHMNITGRFKMPSITGKLIVDTARGAYTELYGIAHDVKGTLKFDVDRVDYNGINGFVEKSKVIADGYSTFEGYSDVKLTFPNMDLTTAQKIIRKSPLLDEVNVTLEDILDASGFADTVIYLTGTDEDLLAKGTLDFKNASTVYKGYAETIKNVTGRLSFIDAKVMFENLKGYIANSPVTANGSIIDGDIIDTVLTSPRADLSAMRRLIRNSSALKATEKIIHDYKSFSGYADTRLHLVGSIDAEKVFKNIKFTISDASFLNSQLGYPVRLSGGQILITAEGIYTGGIHVEALGTPATVTGQMTGFTSGPIKPEQLVPNFKLTAKKFRLDKLKPLFSAPVFPQHIKNSLADFSDLAGQANLNIDFLPKAFVANIDFNNASGRYIPADLPVGIKSGHMTVTQDRIVFNNVYSDISQSSAYIQGTVKEYSTEPLANLLVDATLSSGDIEKYINPYLNEPIHAEGVIPISARLNGTVDKWDIISQATLGKGVRLSYQEKQVLSEDKIRVFSLNATGTRDKVTVNNFEAAIGNTPIQVGTSATTSAGTATSLERLLKASGTIDKLNTDNPVFERFSISTPSPFDITLINSLIKTDTGQPLFSEGSFTGNVLLQGKVTMPQVLGNVKLSDVSIPSRDIKIGYADARFNENEIVISDSYVTIAESPMKFQARISNILERPIIIKSAVISSPSLNIDRISEVLKPVEETPTPEGNVPSFIIESGTICADELVIRNLITTNVSANFDFTPDWLITISDLSFGAAGGSATGQVFYNVKTTETAGNFAARNMQANAAATTLFSLPNEVYGTLNGDVQFQTRGRNSQELIANANGVASFKITDGRLVRLGSLEYLLRAANVIQSGVAGLNINNIIDLIVPQKTGYFETLEGTVTAKDGILKTDNITSKGQNLSLFLSGDLDMVTNNADIRILGRLSKRVSGLLGPLGSLSINTFIGFIPGIGFLPSSPDKGLLDLIPGLSRIPGLGLSGGKYRRFAVNIEGNLYDPSSVRSFRWLD